MMRASSVQPPARKSVFFAVGALLAAMIYLALILRVDSQSAILVLLVAGAAGVFIAARLDLISAFRQSYRDNERAMDVLSIVAVLILAAGFHNNSFILFLLTTVLINIIACLGLNLQFGYAGMLNFAGAAMLGVGGYTAALLGQNAIPPILLLPMGGLFAAVIGSILLPPMLRTQGHYSAVVTIAFNLLFTTFLEVYSGFGGTQGLPVQSMTLFGLDFNDGWTFNGFEVAFYANYFVLGVVLTVIVAAVVRRMERSWIGLSLDAVRLDETSARCFGVNIALWKAVAFIGGNFIIGLAGTFYALMLGYIAPTNFTFGDSLILVTIIILGGLGSIWGVIVTAAIVIILPEKLQAIQEYRFLLYAIVVTFVLLFQPGGLLPRAPRIFFPGWRP